MALNQTLTLKLGAQTVTQVYDFVNPHKETSPPP